MPDGTVVANLESKKKVQGDALLYAVGRQGNVDELNLAAIGIEADYRGRIPVDKDFRTKVPNVFAVGDVIGFPSLASVSMEQGRIAAARAFGDETILSNPSFYPYGIYTIPEISFIGKTEEQLTEEDVPYEVGVAYYREIARGQIRGDTTGRLKLIFHRDDPRASSASTSSARAPASCCTSARPSWRWAERWITSWIRSSTTQRWRNVIKWRRSTD